MNDKNFINEEGLETLISELDNHSDVISGLFDKIDQTISGLPDYYKCSACEAIMNSYHEFRKNYAIIKNNLASYSDDYVCLIQKMKAGDKELAKAVIGYTGKYVDEAKRVNVK